MVRLHLAVALIGLTAVTACSRAEVGTPATLAPQPAAGTRSASTQAGNPAPPSSDASSATSDGAPTSSDGKASNNSAGAIASSELLDVPAEDTALLRVTTDEAVAACMAALGFQYVPTDLATATAAANADVVNRRAELPFDSSSEGATYQPPAVVPARPFDNDAYANTLAPAAREAWAAAALGDFDDVMSVTLPGGMTLEFPKDGCLSEARTATFGSIESAAGFEAGLSRVRIEARVRTEADERVMSAQQAWVACVLTESGRTFERFAEARAYASGHPDEAQSVASVDANCTEQAGLLSTYREVLGDYTAQLIEENLGLIEQYRSDIDSAIERAKDLATG